jgi:hypothetical protein
MRCAFSGYGNPVKGVTGGGGMRCAFYAGPVEGIAGFGGMRFAFPPYGNPAEGFTGFGGMRFAFPPYGIVMLGGMSIRRLSSRTDRLDRSFLAEHLRGARSYRRIAGYFTSSLFEIAHEWLEEIAEVRIVCNVDLSPEDLKVARLREMRLLGRWNERSIKAGSLMNRERYQRLDAFLAQRGPVIRVAPDTVCGFVHGKAGVIERADGRKIGFIGSMNETRQG